MAGRRGCGTWVAAALACLLALAAVCAWAWLRFEHFADTPQAAQVPSLVVARGDSLPGVVRNLRNAGVAGSDLEWRLLARLTGAAGRIKAGEYALQPAASPRTLLARMRDGKVVQYRFTLVDGWNIRQLRAALGAATPLVHATAALSDAELMARLGFPGQHPEGRFLPETYLYQRGDTDLEVLARAHRAMDAALAEAWASRAADLPLQGPDQALVLASIVEKETALASERAQIAGVFVRRLRKGMLLQTDPSVIYGLGEAYDGDIRKRDLTTDTPYNTYTRPGLPPTPIAMPGRDALMAATHPAPGESLYFVAVGDGSGAHVFSATYAEHTAAVARYLQRLRQARGGVQAQ
nr:endolytic transglycosylase MltG [Xanthomonas massiliensis]